MIPYAPFLAQQDMTWHALNDRPGDAPFLGNGHLGTLIRQTKPNELTWLVGNNEVEDHRDIHYGHCRLPIGDFLLHTTGHITGVNLRLSLWDAQLHGQLTTSAGRIQIRAIVHATDPVIFVELIPSAGEKDCRWEFKPAAAVNPRWRWQVGEPDKDVHSIDVKTVKLKDENLRAGLLAYPLYAKAQMDNEGPVSYADQKLAKGQFVTAWVEKTVGDARRLYISNVYQWDDPSVDAKTNAIKTVTDAAARKVETLLASHQAWWHAYYQKSFVSIPDPYWNSFYWIQLYKFACASHKDSPVMDHNGPWLLPTPWPAAWWNLNVELTYWLPISSNHIDEGDSLRHALVEHANNLIHNVPEQFQYDSAALPRSTDHTLAAESGHVAPPGEMGNLAWTLHDVWLEYRMTMDQQMLRDDIFPLLRRSTNYYLHYLKKGPDGRLHLPTTLSPEYPHAGPDTNYDLSLLRWSLQTLIDTDTQFSLHDPLRKTWEQTLATLVDYPQDKDGYLIAANVPYAISHRHYSHLLMIYPLYLVNRENGGQDIIKRSLAHWLSLPKALLGYSFSGSASMYAALGEGDRALKQLDGLKHFIKPNTMYFESGPVLETPFSAAQSIIDMLLQSWPGPQGSIIRVFPGTPSAWQDTAFSDLRAQGAFLVSAMRKAGRTQWVKIQSLAGQPCRVRPGLSGEVHLVDAPPGVVLKDLGEGVFEVSLAQGQTVTLCGDTDANFRPMEPVSLNGPAHHFGGAPTDTNH